MFKKRGSLVACLLIIVLNHVLAQTPIELVKEFSSSSYQKVELLNSGGRSSINVTNEVENYDLLNINKKGIEELYTQGPDNFKLTIPSSKRSNISLLLVEVQMPLMEVEAAPSGQKIKYRPGKHYRGIVEGQEGSWAAISVYEDELYGLISEERSESSYVLGKLKGEETHILYADEELKAKQDFNCYGSDSNLPQLKNEDIFSHSAGTVRSSGKCVQLYFEVDNDIVVNKGGETGAINYITAVYNQMATLYANEQINTSISKILVWTQTSPYTGTNSSNLLNLFGTTRPTFEGDLAMLVAYKGNGGIAYVNGLCAFQKKYSMGYSSIGSTYSNVPTYSWTVNVLAHEFGHLFGSPHTHACAWNGNNTPIDGCAAPEGSCAKPSNPVGGGTIMSYCHTVSGVGINFQNGFGEQPGNLMRSRVAAASCVGTCGTGGGGTTPTTCTSNTVTFELTTDLYPNETSWQITNSSGTVLYSGGPYSNQLTKFTQSLCLPNGCYTFRINDSYGDGICCGQGQGNYKIVFNGSTLATGGLFTSVDSKPFCVSGSTTPTCSDGVKNGNETGVDCGGSCSPCQTDACAGNTAPVSSLTKANQSFVAGTPFIVTANASDNGSVTKVEFWRGTTLLGTDNSSPYEYTLNSTTAASFAIVARAYDNCGAQANSASRTYTATVTCTDGVQNGSETGIDCGGGCTACQTDPCAGNTVPTSSLTKSSQLFVAGTPFVVTANASDNGSVTKVEFRRGTTILSTDETAPYEFVLNSTTAGSFIIVARAYDNCGATRNSTSRTYTATVSCTDGVQNGNETGVDCGGSCSPCQTDPCAGNTVPASSLTKANQSFVAGTPFLIAANASDNGSIAKVEFWGGTTLLGTDNEAPYEYTLNSTTAASFAIVARAYDNCGAQTNSASRTYTATVSCADGVQNGNETGVDCGGSCTACQTDPCAGNIAPTSSLTKSSQSFVAGTPFVITANASDNGSITKVEFRRGTTVLGTDETAPYEFILNSPTAGSFTIVARAYDNCGALTNSASRTYTATVTCTDGVKNGNETGVDCGGGCTACQTDPCAGNTAPTSSLAKASQSFVAGTPFIVTANASDNGSITKVEFWRGTTLLGTDNTAPYEYTLNSTTAASFAIVARAYDNCGAQTNSLSRTYTATVTCTDGVKNGNETGIDCGGSCTACQTGCVNGTVTLVTDRYPNETSWSIRTTSGTIVASGSGYTTRFATFNINVCLQPNTCYNFIINDSYGDGICCSQGQGSYKIDFNGTTLISGGQFTNTETKNFCVPSTSNNINPENNTFLLYPNPANTFIIVKDQLIVSPGETNGKQVKLDMFDSYGKLVKSLNTLIDNEIRVDVEDLPNGQYFIRLLQKEEVLMQNKFMIIR